MSPAHYRRALTGVLIREALRFRRQHGRLAAALFRPLAWLAIFAAGFRAVLGLSIIPPYPTYILYEVYIVPGLVGMMLLFQGMQTSLSMVYDREMGSMKVLLTAPVPRPFRLGARLLANVLIIVPVVYLFLLIARFWNVRFPVAGYIAVLPALVLCGLMLGALALLLSSLVRQLENFAAVTNFIIFPMFFASTALYPLWRLEEGSPWIAWAALMNPLTYAVELIRFSLYAQFDAFSFLVVCVTLLGFFALAAINFDPDRGFWKSHGNA